MWITIGIALLVFIGYSLYYVFGKKDNWEKDQGTGKEMEGGNDDKYQRFVDEELSR